MKKLREGNGQLITEKKDYFFKCGMTQLKKSIWVNVVWIIAWIGLYNFSDNFYNNSAVDNNVHFELEWLVEKWLINDIYKNKTSSIIVINQITKRIEKILFNINEKVDNYETAKKIAKIFNKLEKLRKIIEVAGVNKIKEEYFIFSEEIFNDIDELFNDISLTNKNAKNFKYLTESLWILIILLYFISLIRKIANNVTKQIIINWEWNKQEVVWALKHINANWEKIDNQSIILDRINIQLDNTSKKLEKQAKKLENMEKMVSYCETNLDWNIIYSTEWLQRFTGYNSFELQWSMHNIFTNLESSNYEYNDLDNRINNDIIWELEIEWKKKWWETYVIHSTIYPLYSIDGKKIWYWNIIEDLTYIREKEIIIQQQVDNDKQRLEYDKKLKAAFISKLMHELRTPLAPIMTLSWNLVNNWSVDNQEEMESSYKILRKASERLSGLINDFEDFINIEDWELILNKQSFNLRKMLFEIEEEYIYKVEEKGLIFNFDIKEIDKDLILNSDEIKLKKIIKHLLSNAVKFTEKGWIKITFTYKNNNLNIYISDTGIWMTKKWIDSLFVEFNQEDNSIERKYWWIWLWMNIVKQIVDCMWWKISINSTKWAWTVFNLNLPIDEWFIEEKKQNKKDIIKENLEVLNIKDLKVLIVDDEHLIQLIVWKMFVNKWAKKENIEHAINWHEAVTKVKEGEYDLVIMDYNMPIMNWVDATKKIREFDTDTLIILSSADHKVKFKDWIFDWVVNKPLDFDKSIIEFQELFREKYNKELELI